MRAFVEQFRQRLFLRPTNIYWFAIDDLGHVRRLIVHVADQNRLCWTNDDTSWLKPDIDSVRAEVTFLSRVILRIDKDRVVRTSRHAGFAADTDRFVEIDDAVGALKHCRGGTGNHAGRMRALIAPRHLMGAP